MKTLICVALNIAVIFGISILLNKGNPNGAYLTATCAIAMVAFYEVHKLKDDLEGKWKY